MYCFSYISSDLQFLLDIYAYVDFSSKDSKDAQRYQEKRIKEAVEEAKANE